jgi:nitrite reductase/ring-hydroxylating ferredoxin subunit
MGTSALTRVGEYERTIRASPARIVENVLDWEHLPWLHRSSFAAVEPLDESPQGWRGRVVARGNPLAFVIDVRFDRPSRHYVSRSLEGLGEGTEIHTWLDPVAERATRIRVQFDTPLPPGASADKIGAAYRVLYARLWDEDEAMMMRRQQLLDTRGERAGAARGIVPLGRIDELRRGLPRLVRVDGAEFRLVEVGGRILAHPTVCPHLGGPLEAAAVEDGCITCPWHGYRYDLASGRCASGQAYDLGPRPVVSIDERSGEAELVW